MTATNNPSVPEYDVCIIGCGPAGFASAMRALDLGKKVCIVERAQIGGAGVMWGALSSKTMWELAKDVYVAGRTDRGYRAESLTVDYTNVRLSVIQAVKDKQDQMRSQLKAFTRENWSGPGHIDFWRGHARFLSPNRIAVGRHDGSQKELQAEFTVITTGSKPRALPQIAVDQKRVLDSDGILRLKVFPRRLMIVGAGIVGCEYAAIFSNFGQTEVILVDHKDRILPFEDEDVSAFVSHNLERRGVEIVHSAKLEAVRHTKDGVLATLATEDGQRRDEDVDAILVSIGRVPNCSDLGLERIGILPDDRGYLKVDENCRVQDNIYAAGDVTRHPALVNLAETEGRYAVKHMYGLNRWPLRYDNMTTVMFFYPPVAAVGFNEKECREKGIAYRVAYYSYELLHRAIAMRAMDGFVKIIVSCDDDPHILGMRAAGPHVSTTIMSVALLMDQDKGIRDVLKSQHPHPTMSEAIQECLRVLLGKSIYKPHAFPDQIQIRTWAPDGGAAA